MHHIESGGTWKESPVHGTKSGGLKNDSESTSMGSPLRGRPLKSAVVSVSLNAPYF